MFKRADYCIPFTTISPQNGGDMVVQPKSPKNGDFLHRLISLTPPFLTHEA